MSEKAVVEIRVVALAILRGSPATQVLVFRRKSGQSFAGFYEFPGGKIEAGETEEAALRREIDEELSLQIGPLEKVGENLWNSGAKLIRLILFKTNWQPDMKIQLLEHDDLLWIGKQSDLPLAPADIPFLQALFE